MTATRTVLAILALVMGASGATPAMAAGSVIGAVHAESTRKGDKAAKAAEARESGAWTVEKGESLLRICRYLSDDPATRRALAIAILEDNPGAFVEGDRARLVVGARLRLRTGESSSAPARVRAQTDAAASGNGPASSDVANRAGAPEVAAPTGPVAHSNGRANGSRNGRRNGVAVGSPGSEVVPYRDQLIDDSVSQDLEAMADEDRDATMGRRGWAVGLLGEMRRFSGGASTRTGGISVSHFRETEQHGDFLLDLLMGETRADAFFLADDRRRFRATLYHNNFALSDTTIASSALGVVRSSLPPWLSSSYRVNLSSSQLLGLTTMISSRQRDLYLSVGDIGRSFGALVQGFERTSGRLASVALVERLPEGWLASAGALSLEGNDLTRDHTGLTFSIGRENAGTGDFVKAQALVDDDRNWGALVDAQVRRERTLHRFGAYQLEPGLVFGESSAQSDVRGAYWRAEARKGGDFASFGAEYNENNYQRDPARGGVESLGGYANYSLRLDRSTQVGAGLSIRNERPVTEVGERRWVTIANAYGSRTGPWGVARLDMTYNRSRPERSEGDSSSTVTWNQDWPAIAGIDTNTFLTLSNEREPEGRTRRTSASLALQGPIARDFRWNAMVTWVDVNGVGRSERNYNTSVGVDWQLDPQWLFQLQWLRNEIQPTATEVAAPFLRENTVQLTLRWSETTGASYGVSGPAAARSASGRIMGEVFFDENGDGIRQPTERGAANVTLLLNGRMPQVTDRDGRFAFPLVPSGSYRVSVSPERVPLPWGMADETPKSVTVGVRQDARIDFGLTRVAP